MAQEAWGLGVPTTSTKHMRQLPAIDSRSWKQKRGISAPAASHACSSVYSGGTSISLPSTMSLVMPRVSPLKQDPSRPLLLRRLRHRRVVDAHGVGVGGVLVDAPFDLGAEVPQQALHRPGGAVAEGAN